MGKLDKDGGKSLKLTRRQFLQASAATAAVGAAGFDFAAKPSSANAADVAFTYHTTCPYCSASCGQLVDVDADGNVLDIYGDHMAPWNAGGLCSKGAGSFQLVNNERRLGAFSSHPENPVFNYDPAFDDTGVGLQAHRQRRVGPRWSCRPRWTRLRRRCSLHAAILPALPTENNSKSVAFFGSSHLNNDQNNLYRKIIANFGTSNIEHQARI
jgi:formate dehydrogenase major subunit